VYVTSQEIVFNSTCYSLQSSTYKYYEVPDQFFFAQKRQSEKNSQAESKKNKGVKPTRESIYMKYEQRRVKLDQQKVWKVE
jgi:hypothetical protein